MDRALELNRATEIYSSVVCLNRLGSARAAGWT
jgi:hypothetical protein